MIAKHFVGNVLGNPRQQLEIDARLEFFQEPFGGPAFFHEEILEAGAIAAFAQDLLVAKDLCDCVHHAHRLLGKDESVQTDGKMRLIGEPSADADSEANLTIMLHRREGDVVDLGIGAPRGATGDGDLEFARQVVEVRVCGEQMSNFERRWVRRQALRHEQHRQGGSR